MSRIRADYVFGTTDAALTATDTTLSSAALSRLPEVTASDVAAITLHDSATGAYEIVHVTAHTASATTATILRGQEGSTAQVWGSGAAWLHGPTAGDLSVGTIASTHYYPATAATYTPTTTMTDVDATNAAITFTTPESGVVLVEFGAGANCRQLAGIQFALREGDVTLPDTLARNFYFPNGVDGVQMQASNTWRIAGLTPGSRHTYKLGFQLFGMATSGPTVLQAGGSEGWGPLVLAVRAG